MTRVYHGVIHGKTIQVSEDLGLAEGQEVEITVRTVPVAHARQPGEGLLRTEGRWPMMRIGMRSWRKFTGRGSKSGEPLGRSHNLGEKLLWVALRPARSSSW